jgi:GNAT superfamily N-acetyltransferase
MKIVHKSDLSKTEIEFLRKEFRIYAEENGVKDAKWMPFSFVAMQDDEIIGILDGHTLYDEVCVDDLVVLKDYRNNGIGTKLLRAAEDFYRGKNFTYISLKTAEFLAPKFYSKLGFSLEYVRENKKNPKLTRYFFIKYL